MRKCPRCQHDVKDQDRYCSHCGLDMSKKQKGWFSKIPPRFKIYFFIVIVFFIIPYFSEKMIYDFYSRLIIDQNEVIALEPLSQEEPLLVVASYDSLEAFKQQFSNVDAFVEEIEAFESDLSQQGTYELEKHYDIQVYDNYDVNFTLNYVLNISESYVMEVDYNYDRSQTINEKEIRFIKENAHDFDNLFLTQEEQAWVDKYCPQAKITALIDAFKEREDEFEQKKESLGHYGMGEYNDKESFVVYRYQKEYMSVLTIRQ